MLFDSFSEIGRVAAVGVLAYAALVAMLRVSGNRTLSKMNAFDFVVTVALGSTLATILLSERVALAEGVVALAVLVGLQFVVTWLSVRSAAVQRLVKGEPTLLCHDGHLLAAAMRRARVTADEVLAAVRLQGLASVEDVQAVVLETDGSFAVIKRADGDASALANVTQDAESARA